MTRAVLGLGLLALVSIGCSTLPQAYSADSGEEAGIVDLKEYEGAGAEGADGPPRNEEVAWEDNGRPIRERTPDPRPRELKVPANNVKKDGQIVDLEEANAESAKKKKATAKK